MEHNISLIIRLWESINVYVVLGYDSKRCEQMWSETSTRPRRPEGLFWHQPVPSHVTAVRALWRKRFMSCQSFLPSFHSLLPRQLGVALQSSHQPGLTDLRHVFPLGAIQGRQRCTGRRSAGTDRARLLESFLARKREHTVSHCKSKIY